MIFLDNLGLYLYVWGYTNCEDTYVFAERLREAMQLRRISATQLAKKTDIGESTIFRYLSGDREPIFRNLVAIAGALGVGLDFLAGTDSAAGDKNTLVEVVERLATDVRSTLGIREVKDAPLHPGSPVILGHIPVIGKMSLGPGFEFSEEGYPCGEPVFAIPRSGDDDPHAFGVIFEGDSMTLRILDGDVVICSPREEWESGDLVLLRKTSGELAVNEISHRRAYYVLRSYNPAYDLEEIPEAEVSFVHKLTSIRPRQARKRRE